MNLKRTALALSGIGAISPLIFTISTAHSTDPPSLGEMVAMAGKSQSDGGWQKDARGNLYKDNEILVRLKPHAATHTLEHITGRLDPRARVALSTRTLADPAVPDLFLLKVDNRKQAAVMSALRAEPDTVLYAEPNYQLKATATVPNDTEFANLWGMNNTGQTGGVVGADISAPEAWDKTRGSRNVVVAVVDTGVDYTHPDLARNIWTNPAEVAGNGLDDDNNGVVDDIHGINVVGIDPTVVGCASRPTAGDSIDDYGHGTHVAGTIGAYGNNGRGVAGVNWNVSIMSAKFLDAQGSGTTVGALMALQYVYTMKKRGVNIVATNNSWGGGGYSRALFDTIDSHRQAGILFIAAAGNSSLNNDVSPSYPASYGLPNIIAVAATDSNDGLASFSNWGNYAVDVGAPGVDILSTCPPALSACGSTRAYPYAKLSGTSMATPHVTGLAALLKAQTPTRDWKAIKNLILSTADPAPALAGITSTGGRINASAAVNCTPASPVSFAVLNPTPQTDVIVNRPVVLEARNIQCEAGIGAVTATPAGGSPVTLLDNGVYPDKVAGDGIFSGAWTPTTFGSKVIAFSNGGVATNVTIQAAPLLKYNFSNVTHSFTDISTTGTWLNTGNDGDVSITTPFPIWLYGRPSTQLVVSANGTISQNCTGSFQNQPLPAAGSGSCTLVAPFWDDIEPSTGGGVYWKVDGTAPGRVLRVQWNNAPHYDLGGTNGVTFQAEFREAANWNTPVVYRYKDVAFGDIGHDNGASATVGVQKSEIWGQQFSYNTASLADNTSKQLAPAGVTTPLAMADPMSLNYYYQLVGKAADQKVWLSNLGNAKLTLATLAVVGSANFTLVSPPAMPLVILPGRTVALTVRYTPSVEGGVGSELQIGTDGGNRTVSLSGSGTTEPDINLSASYLYYGAVAAGGNVSKTLTISNTGNAALFVDDIEINAPFSIAGALPPYTVAPGATKVLTVKFAPTVAGVVSQPMYLYSSDPDEAAVQVNLSGQGQ